MLRVFSLLVLFVTVASGCQIAGPDDPRTSTDAQQRTKWDAYQNGTYEFTIIRGCFCINGGEHQVSVTNNKVTSAYSVWREEAYPAEQLEYFETIDDLFEMLERARLEADEITVTFSEHGYPSELIIDWIKEAVDDEIAFTISKVTVPKD